MLEKWFHPVSEKKPKKELFFPVLVSPVSSHAMSFFFFFFFLRWHPLHMEVPRLAVQWELQLLAFSTATATQDPSNTASAAYTTAHGKAGSLTHWVRPGIKPMSSWILVRFITAVLPRELHAESSESYCKDLEYRKKKWQPLFFLLWP